MKQTREQYLVARIELLTNQLDKAREKLAAAVRKNEMEPVPAEESKKRKKPKVDPVRVIKENGTRVFGCDED